MGGKSKNARSELAGVAETRPPPSDESAVVSRPTARPPFDSKVMRERMTTVTDEVALEKARLASFRSDAPPARASVDSLVEIAMGEADLDALDESEQLALLRDRIGPLTRVPKLLQRVEELGAVITDPKAAYVLGFVDGLLPLETIIDVVGLPELDTLRVIDAMASQGVLVFRS